MPGIHHFELFLLTGILLNLTPGNDTIFILTKSITGGRQAGIMSALGIGTGSIIHTVLAALGLSIIISKSIFVFTVIKFAGAGYLIYLGIKMLKEKTKLKFSADEINGKINSLKIYRNAMLTNLLNPKVALFFIAFLPQFIDPAFKNNIVPFLMLGMTFTFTGTTWCIVLAVFSSQIFSRLRNNQTFSSWLHKISGTILIAVGLKIAVSGRK